MAFQFVEDNYLAKLTIGVFLFGEKGNGLGGGQQNADVKLTDDVYKKVLGIRHPVQGELPGALRRAARARRRLRLQGGPGRQHRSVRAVGRPRHATTTRQIARDARSAAPGGPALVATRGGGCLGCAGGPGGARGHLLLAGRVASRPAAHRRPERPPRHHRHAPGGRARLRTGGRRRRPRSTDWRPRACASISRTRTPC